MACRRAASFIARDRGELQAPSPHFQPCYFMLLRFIACYPKRAQIRIQTEEGRKHSCIGRAPASVCGRSLAQSLVLPVKKKHLCLKLQELLPVRSSHVKLKSLWLSQRILWTSAVEDVSTLDCPGYWPISILTKINPFIPSYAKSMGRLKT